jgi:hypothetical protein
MYMGTAYFFLADFFAAFLAGAAFLAAFFFAGTLRAPFPARRSTHYDSPRPAARWSLAIRLFGQGMHACMQSQRIMPHCASYVYLSSR